jgi:predicted porin
MYKSLAIVALAAAAAAPAFAQSSVTMYGRFNVTIEREKFGDVSSTDMNNNASRIGMKGVEDLGGGLKAGFQIEHGFNVDTGAASQGNQFWARQSEVNLSGGFGMIRLGNFTSEAYYATADYISMHNHDTGTSADALWAYIGRNTDKVAYRTPDIAGFTLEGAVTARDVVGQENRTFDVAGNYNVGKLSLGAGYTKDGDAKMGSIRGLYDFGSFVLGGYYQRDTDGVPSAFGLSGYGSRNTFRVSAMVPVGASEFHVNLGVAGKYSNIPDSKANQWTLAYGYNFSKRTKAYAYFTKISDDAGSRGILGVTYAGGDFQSFAVGMRHNF